MGDVNKILVKPSKPTQPAFAAGNCKFGTIGKDINGELWMWTDASRAVNLKTGFTKSQPYIEKLFIAPLVPFSVIELSVNEEQ